MVDVTCPMDLSEYCYNACEMLENVVQERVQLSLTGSRWHWGTLKGAPISLEALGVCAQGASRSI